MFFAKYFTIAFIAALAFGEAIQLTSSQGILIPAPIAQRMTRSAYGGYTGPTNYAAPVAFQQASSSSSASSSGSSSAAAAPAYDGGHGYNAPSVPSPPCPRNYLFSCAPALTPVPCAAPAPSYGAPSSYGSAAGSAQISAANPQGAYSEFISQFARPSYGGY